MRSSTSTVMLCAMLMSWMMISLLMTSSWGIFMVVTAAAASSSSSSMIISKQPSSIATAVRELQKYQQEENIVDPKIVSCIMITSRSVTSKQQQQHIMNDMLSSDGVDDNADNDKSYKAIATSDGILFLQPSSVMEAVQLVAKSTTPNVVVYYPDPIDLQRGEGLTETLGPVLETILQQQEMQSESSPPLIHVLIPDGMDASFIQIQLETSLLELLPYWIVHNDHQTQSTTTTKANPTSTITRVRDLLFSKIVYVTSSSIRKDIVAAAAAAASSSFSSNTNSDLLLQRRLISSSNNNNPNSNLEVTTTTSPQSLVASNILRPIAQQQYQNIVAALQRTCYDGVTSTTATTTDATKKDLKFIPNFGELCDAIVAKEMAFWYDNNDSSSSIDKSLRKSIVGRQICEKLYDDVFMYVLQNIFMEHISKLQKLTYDTLKKDLSKLVISPNLPTDMNRIGQASITTFVTDTVRLIPKTSFVASHHTSYLYSYVTSVQRTYVRKVQEYIQNRILLAQASGKYRPLPRKGITIGMHYLLPKPFGNDYRQEPSMIHATDNMVYVPPRSKLSDVSPEQITSGNGDWKDSIIPHPPGNDMLYMQ